MTNLTVNEALHPCEHLMPLIDGMRFHTAAGYAWAVMMFDVYTSLLSVPQALPIELKGIA